MLNALQDQVPWGSKHPLLTGDTRRAPLREFAPDVGTNVKYLGSVFLNFKLKKSLKIIKEILGHWDCFGVKRF